MIRGTLLLDLRDCPRDRMRSRVAALASVPDNVRAVVIVGALAAEPDAARLLAEHQHRIDIELQGTAHAVEQWLELVREPDILVAGAVP